MRPLPNMVDMALSPKEAEEECSPAYDPAKGPKYPWGLCISLTQEELDKLQLSASDVEIGDIVHIMAFAKVTSISSSETQEGDANSRVELQIIALASEDEDEEGDDDEAKEPANPIKSFYG